MNKVIGKTYDGEDIFKIDKDIGVSEHGDILILQKDKNFYDTDFCVNVNPRIASKDEMKKNIYKMNKIIVNGHKIHLGKDTIDNEPYKLIDIEDLYEADEKELREDEGLNDEQIAFFIDKKIVEMVVYKDNFFGYDENDKLYIRINNNHDKEAVDKFYAIAQAFEGEFDKETFISFEKMKKEVKEYD